MSEIKHTPGPWFVVDNRVFLEIRTSEYEYGGEQIGDVCSSKYIDGHEDNPVAQANARLIAAAPELLAIALQYASECGECAGTGRNDCGHEGCQDCAFIHAVIAKATGSQS